MLIWQWGILLSPQSWPVDPSSRPQSKAAFESTEYNMNAFFTLGFPGGSDDKESACNAGDPGSVPGLGRSPEEGHGNPLQHFCLGNPMDRRAWWATVHGVAKSRTQLSN